MSAMRLTLEKHATNPSVLENQKCAVAMVCAEWMLAAPAITCGEARTAITMKIALVKTERVVLETDNV